MAFRASSIIKSEALKEIKTVALRARDLCQQHHTTMAAGNVSATDVLRLLKEIRALIIRWETLAATPGLDTYAEDQENDVNYDVVAEYNLMRTALINIRDRIVGSLPVATQPPSAAGKLAIYSLDPSGDFISVFFTPSDTTLLRSDLAAFIATVE